MKPSVAKQYRRRPSFLDIITHHNFILLLGIDLPFIVVAATSLKSAVALALEMFFIHVVVMLLTFVVARRMHFWQRAVLVVIFSTASMLLARRGIVYLFPEVVNSSRLYLYLMAVNAMTLIQAIFLRREVTFKETMQSAFVNVFAFSGMMLVVGSIREYLGAGTLWGFPLPILFKMEGVGAPFFGFILLGFLLVGARLLSRRIAMARMQEHARRDAPYRAVDSTLD